VTSVKNTKAILDSKKVPGQAEAGGKRGEHGTGGPQGLGKKPGIQLNLLLKSGRWRPLNQVAAGRKGGLGQEGNGEEEKKVSDCRAAFNNHPEDPKR